MECIHCFSPSLTSGSLPRLGSYLGPAASTPGASQRCNPGGEAHDVGGEERHGEHNDTTTHHEAVEHLGHFCGVFDPRCCDSSLHFCDDSVINPLEV